MNSHPRTSQCKDNRSSASGRLTSSILQRHPGGDSRPPLSSRAKLDALVSRKPTHALPVPLYQAMLFTAR
jgi:hypothetical protein